MPIAVKWRQNLKLFFMKKLLSLLMIVLMAIAMAFVGCKKDDKNDGGGSGGNGGGGNGGGGGGGGGGTTGGYPVEATNVQGDNGDITKVEAWINNFKSSTVDYNNHGFKVSLPSTVADKDLDQYGEADANFCAINKDGNKLGYFYYSGENDAIYADYTYTYTNEAYDDKGDYEVTLNGKTYLLKVDMSMKKGWNIVYFGANKTEGYLFSYSTKPALTYAWIFDAGNNKAPKKFSSADFKNIRNLHR
jgi:hypothetical protein